jgi:hypothetical protein
LRWMVHSSQVIAARTFSCWPQMLSDPDAGLPRVVSSR